jgi:hypothetical protein
MEGDSLSNFYEWLDKKRLDFKEFARRQVRKQNIQGTKLTNRQWEMWEYFVYDEQGYDHIRVNGDGTFRPEILRAVNAIRATIQGFRDQDTKATNILESIKEKERRRDNGNYK